MIVAWGLCLLLALATTGEGGAAPGSMLAQHLLFAGLLIVALSARETSWRLPMTIAVPLGVFAALAFVGALVAPYGYAAYLVLVELAIFVAVAALAARCGPGLLVALGATAGAVAVLQSVWAISQRAGHAVLRPSGGFLNPNHLAAWLTAALFLIWGLAATRSRAARAAAGVATVLAVLVLVIIGSRGVVVGLAAGGAAAFACTASGRNPKAMRVVGILALVGLVVGAAGVFLRFRIADPLGAARPAIWKAASYAVVENPWLGSGPGQFETLAANLTFPREGDPLRFEHAFSTPHSDVLRAPAEFGIPAALAALLAAVLSIRALVRRARAGDLDATGIGAVAALAALAAQATVNDLTETPGLYLLFAAVFGSLLSEEKGTVPVSKGTVPFLLVLLVPLCAVEIASYRSWTIQASLPRGALAPAQRAALERARTLNRYQPDLAIRAAENLVFSVEPFSRDSYAAAREAAEEAIRLSPRSPLGYRALARVEGRGCRDLFHDVATRERAAAAYAHAETNARHDPFLPLEAAQLLLATGDVAGARRAATRALRIEPNAIPPRLVLARVALADKTPEGADEARKMLAEADDLARRFATLPRESPYAVALLAEDPEVVARIRDTLDGRKGP